MDFTVASNPISIMCRHRLRYINCSRCDRSLSTMRRVRRDPDRSATVMSKDYGCWSNRDTRPAMQDVNKTLHNNEIERRISRLLAINKSDFKPLAMYTEPFPGPLRQRKGAGFRAASHVTLLVVLASPAAGRMNVRLSSRPVSRRGHEHSSHLRPRALVQRFRSGTIYQADSQRR